MKRRKKKPQPPQRDWRSFMSGCVVAAVVLGAIGDRVWKALPNRVQHAQLVQVDEDALEPIPEITEEIDAPPPAVQPPQEEAEEPVTRTPAEEPTILREIQIEGPVDAIVGDPVHLRVRADGPVKNFAWSIFPDVDGLFVLDDGESAIFTNRNAQPYTIYVSAADARGNLSQDVHTFELVQQKETLTLRNLNEANPDPTVPELVHYYVTLVQSNNKEREVQIVAQSFRQAANLLRTGAITAGDDVLATVEQGLEVTMGPPTFQKWTVFFDSLRLLLTDYAAKGYLENRDAWVNTLDNLATILENR